MDQFKLSRAAWTLIVLVGLSGCGHSDHPKAPPPPEVEVVIPKVEDVPVYKEWVSTLDGMVNAQIRAQVTGYLTKQSFKEGDFIKAGQLLYEIDSRTFKASFDEAKANLAKQEAIEKTARIDIQRIERLLPENAVSVRDRDNAAGREASAAAEVLAMRAALEKAQLDLEFTRIKAPIDGIVGISKAQIGDLVGPGGSNTSLTVISQVDPIRAYISLSEQEYLYISRQLIKDANSAPRTVELVLADGSQFEYRGQFIFADRHVDTQTGSILVAASFPNPQQLLRPGQFGRVRVFTELLKGALLVPQRAVQEVQGRHQVAVVSPEQKINFRTVEVGERIGALWVITQGINAGEAVVVEGLQKVQEGAPVKAIPFVAPDSESAS